MDKNLIVTIFAPTKGKDGGSRTGRNGKIGTGYPVGEDLILTSRHVVNPEQRDENYPLLVRWHYYPPEDKKNDGWVQLSPEDVVWSGEGELDAALLRCPLPEKARGRSAGNVVNKKPP